MFKFSLETVLDHRKTVEEALQRSLAQATAILDALQAKKEEVQEKIQTNQSRLSEIGLDLARRGLHENWLQWAQGEIQRIDHDIKEAETEVEARRGALIEAAKATAIMEKLEEREEQAWRQEEERAEQRQYEELALRKYLMNKRKENVSVDSERIA